MIKMYNCNIMGNRLIIEKIKELKNLVSESDPELIADLAKIELHLTGRIGESAWQRVQLARHTERPGTLDYIELISDRYLLLHGDRRYSDDPAIVGGVAEIGGIAVTFIGHQKGRNLKENVKRNGGMGSPEGYRKALRLARQAAKFGRPVITFIDTPGAYPGLGAEERGVGEAIACNLREFSVLKTPILCYVIGEGGSGGALGIGVGDKIYMLENAVYSVISPEGFASILLRDAAKAEYAASIMKLTAQDMASFGIVHDVLPEAPGGAQNDPAFTAERIKETILNDIKKLSGHDPQQLVRYRSKKIREIGHVAEPTAMDQLFHLFSRIPWLKGKMNQ